jgi:D-glycero-alpha-D-manno-heptose-7-phosphate kinase
MAQDRSNELIPAFSVSFDPPMAQSRLMKKESSRLRAATTITPLRISFAGGGTDIPSYFARKAGAVVSSTIDKYVYVTVKRHSPLFGETYRLNYSKTEHVNRLDDIENDIARECLRQVPVEPPLFISTAADLPALSGLGSSSSFAVGLLYALHALRGEDVSAGQLAEEACHIEIDALKRPIGKQDQYAAAFGGLNYITFQSDHRVNLDPLWMPREGVGELFRHGMLFWTGQQREASDILKRQVRKIGRAESGYRTLFDLANDCRDSLLGGFKSREFAKILDAGWQIKRGLSEGISNRKIDHWYKRALDAGALGGKLLGAGGGGFLYLVVPPKRQRAVRTRLKDMFSVHLGYEPRGARILSTLNE